VARIHVYPRTQTDPLAHADMETAKLTQARCILGRINMNEYILVRVFIYYIYIYRHVLWRINKI